MIAKGTGSVGNKGYKLRESMELVHDTDLVNVSEASATFATRRALILAFHMAGNQ